MQRTRARSAPSGCGSCRRGVSVCPEGARGQICVRRLDGQQVDWVAWSRCTGSCARSLVLPAPPTKLRDPMAVLTARSPTTGAGPSAPGACSTLSFLAGCLKSQVWPEKKTGNTSRICKRCRALFLAPRSYAHPITVPQSHIETLIVIRSPRTAYMLTYIRVR